MSDNFLDDVANLDLPTGEETKANGNTNRGRKQRKEFLVDKFTITDDDNELAIFVKELIFREAPDLTNVDVYDIFGRTVGWNMVYGLMKGNMSWKRLKEWCNIIGFEPEITLNKIK